MKQLLILSGKGGTGKTTIAGAFIKLSSARVFADCDVDAPNLHLIMQQTCEPKRTDYYGMQKVEIDSSKCIECGLCKENCRFGALSWVNGYEVDPFVCEGCGVCEAVCPTGAIILKPNVAGELKLYADENSVFSTAQLKMGSGTSGKLVNEVKKQMENWPIDTKLTIIDGSPGIGCPVIASLRGVDMVLIITEPSISGISDMERIIRTAETFQIQIGVCVNKYDTNCENTDSIKKFCTDKGIPYMGGIPFDAEAVKAVNKGQTIVDVDCPSGCALREVFHSTIELLFNESEDNKH